MKEDLGDARAMRTAHMETQAIDALIATAQTAVSGLDQVTSSRTDVAEARAAVAAVTAAIADSTEADKAALSAQISAAATSLTSIVTYRSTAAGQLAVANSAIARANALVSALSATSTPEEAAAAYGALAEASLALHTATNLPDNVIARLQGDLQSVQDTLSDTQSVTSAVVAATTAVAGLDNDSLEADVMAARTAVDAAVRVLASAVNVSPSDKAGLQAAIDSLETSLSTVEMVVAARPTEAQTESAATKETAIDAEAEQPVAADRGLGGTAVDPTNDGEAYTLSIERDRDDTTIKIGDPQVAGEDDPEFVKQEDMDLGEGRTMFVREMEEDDDGNVVKEAVIIQTDIDAPTGVLFAKFENAEGMLTQVLTVRDDDLAVGEDNPANSFEVDENSETDRGLVMSASFTAGTAAVLSFTLSMG